jgi:hypothetical protein
VNVLYGATGVGLGAERNQLWHQDVEGIEGGAEPGDSFGLVLSARNFGKGTPVDLAIAAPNEALGTIASAGSVHVIYGQPRTRP